MMKQAMHFTEAFTRGITNKDYEYLVGAMQPIDAEYTENTFREADRVKSQLAAGLPARITAEFDYQGSVTSDTHIRIYSDIDLLVLHGSFISLDDGAQNTSPYEGNPIAELIALRGTTTSVLRNKFPAADVETSGGKAISLSGGSLARKIDVIVGNWWDTELWKQFRVKMARGINVLDSKVPTRIKNKPFYHNFKLNEKDKKTGGLRKTIRLLKTLKYDAEQKVEMASYNIASIAYNMSDASLSVEPGAYLQLARNAESELRRFINDQATRESLLVPNGMRKVFGGTGATLSGLKALHKELSDLLSDIRRTAAPGIIEFSERLDTPSRRIWAESRPASVKAHSF